MALIIPEKLDYKRIRRGVVGEHDFSQECACFRFYSNLAMPEATHPGEKPLSWGFHDRSAVSHCAHL
ncbi:hypothetical protein BFJ66_g854 [Fusarium oxysporum f. sp. cepae]|uniref:Uncharacterized protein n=1 Tax=Fusarium oxysporum f. sp. cepae TaxID=396571 RepID=A0A3L6NY86_FUSOX|nr:hypothetical protein BFJ65_g2786 [Fusarium oxysporum f. sp. cepae]RKK62398.1 hypothetical protein BFJ67_g1343 [Fusarium oxysporum f. sp. cepae]RKK62561.1 hypothetical protein BFJ66_g854 [Fusarium oxysporum f. sp. cepae]